MVAGHADCRLHRLAVAAGRPDHLSHSLAAVGHPYHNHSRTVGIQGIQEEAQGSLSRPAAQGSLFRPAAQGSLFRPAAQGSLFRLVAQGSLFRLVAQGSLFRPAGRSNLCLSPFRETSGTRETCGRLPHN